MGTKKGPASPRKKATEAATKQEEAKSVIQAPEKVTKSVKKKVIKKRKPKKSGRKAWEPNYKDIENMAMQGLKDYEIASLCDVCYQTFSERKTGLNETNENNSNEPTELKKALDRGKARGTRAVSAKLMNFIEQGSLDATKFYLKTVSKWQETPAGTVTIETGEDGKKTRVTIGDLYKDLREAE